MKLFQQSSPPPEQSRLPINEVASWFTWSEEFRAVYRAWTKHLRKFDKPQLIHLMGGGVPYDYTFSFGESSPTDEGLAEDLNFFIQDLYDSKLPTELMLFTGLIDDDLDGEDLHYLFTYFRDAIARLAMHPMCALYAPLGNTEGDFPLHADLYIPRILFNVFEDVPDDLSGASVFLSVATLKELLPQVKSLPDNVRINIMRYLTEQYERDLYSEFFNILYGAGCAWVEELEKNMNFRKLRIKLYSGQGYLINDRLWLHGRETLNGSFSKKRLHRLIFNTRSIQQSF